jgi:NhaA family Na+:H+ antiporter
VTRPDTDDVAEAHAQPGDRQVVAYSWRERDAFIPRTVVRPLERVMQLEISTAVVVLVAALIALVLANTPLQRAYEAFWTTPLLVELGGHHVLDLSLRALVNDGLMALFFMVVALEIKREWVFGELRDRKAAALPIVAAVGGMVVPAAIYLAFNGGGPASHGWGIPMATDIAFAVAVLAAAGPRVPASARLFLLTLAIADDLGAILVIAVFYAHGLNLAWLAAAVAMLVLAAVFARMHVRAVGVYVVVGVLCWFFMHESGVHATIAGVAMGFLTPAWSLLSPKQYPTVAYRLVDQIADRFRDDQLTHEEHALNYGTLREIRRLSLETQAPLDRIEYRLSSWSAFAIVPLFAFANAGVVIPRVSPVEWLSDPVVLGVGLGLVLGKTVGVFAAAWLAVRTGVARMPPGLRYSHVLGVSICAGVGFTVAMFVANLAFPGEAELAESAKLGIIVGSAVAGAAGYLALRLTPASRPPQG